MLKGHGVLNLQFWAVFFKIVQECRILDSSIDVSNNWWSAVRAEGIIS